jgi:cytochrome c556
MISELYAEILRTEEVAGQPEDFRELLRDSQTTAQQLEAELKTWSASEQSTDPPVRLTQLAGRISPNCKSCHQKYRDVPLSEKQH